MCQKRPNAAAKETWYSSKRDLSKKALIQQLKRPNRYNMTISSSKLLYQLDHLQSQCPGIFTILYWGLFFEPPALGPLCHHFKDFWFLSHLYILRTFLFWATCTPPTLSSWGALCICIRSHLLLHSVSFDTYLHSAHSVIMGSGSAAEPHTCSY